jgi:beta-phosphoglucomutase-like phosphatase (HAD superfamily)
MMSQMTGRPDGIVFDLDGTLVETMEHLYGVYSDFLNARGVVADVVEIAALSGPPMAAVVAALKRRHRLAGSAADLLADYRDRLQARYVACARTTPGALRAVRALWLAGVPLAVATGATRALAEQVLARLRLAECFAALVTGDDSARGKPAPDPYRLAVKRLRLRASACWAVDDSVPGVRSAVAAGLAVIGYAARTPAAALEAAGAARTLERLAELPALAGVAPSRPRA